MIKGSWKTEQIPSDDREFITHKWELKHLFGELQTLFTFLNTYIFYVNLYTLKKMHKFLYRL